MPQTQARVYEIDWKDRDSLPIPDDKTLEKYDAVLLRFHTREDFIDAMEHVHQWRSPRINVGLDKPIIVVHDDELDVRKFGPGDAANPDSSALAAYITLITKKYVDATFSASIFDESMRRPTEEGTLLDKILAVNDPTLSKPSERVERFSRGNVIITRGDVTQR